MLSGKSTPINLQGSANNLIRYYPNLSNCTASFEDASYSIGLGDPLKIENSSNSSHIKN